jgi:glycosyltransferase involved in cell wall biosynthesis
VGTLEPRKNLTFLLEIMPEIYKAGYQLLIVGGRGWKNSSCFDIVSSDGYPKEANVFCGYVTNEELSDLYRMAECLVSASLNEGFGLPQLEALKCGCRVVTAHNSAMIEVAEGIQGAYTVEGYDQQTWIDAILKCCKEKKEVKGSRLNCYDWNFVIEGLLEYIR